MTKADAGWSAGELECVQLGPRDVDEVYDLHALCLSQSPRGHLTARTRRDYERLLGDADNVICAGFRDAGRLVAHSTCHRLTANPYGDNPVLAAIRPATDTAYHGDGTVVHPDYRKRQLAKRLFQLRREQMADRSIEHMLYLVAIDNLASLVALFPGVMLVGFIPDDTAMNFIAYCGRLQAGVDAHASPIMVDWRQAEKQRRLFDRRWVACTFGPSSGAPRSVAEAEEYQFGFVPMA